MKDSTLLTLAAALAVWAGAAWAQAPDPAALSQLRGAEREQRLVEGARREGEANVYTSLVSEDMAAVTAAFEKKYGVKAKYWRAGSEKLLQRAITEARSSRFDVDVLETNGPELEAMYREKILARVSSAHDADLLPAAIRAHRQWVGLRLNLFVQAYNTNLVKAADLPRSYGDLLDPKWKGKLVIEAEDFDWLAGVVKGMGEKEGIKLFSAIAATNGLGTRKGHTLLAGLVASGEVPVALTLYSHNVDRLKKKGAPIDRFTIQPAYARVNGVAVAAKAPHPHAALLFYDFMLSPEGQEILQNANYVPTNLKLGNPVTRSALNFIDPALVLDESSRWEKYLHDLTRGR
ncbi:MAG TPA: extracellular solute-binding protein [Burkholderiales bacterium]